MKKCFYLVAILFIAIVQITFAQQTPPEKKVLIDIANLNGGAVADIFAESEYIPLENTKESQINRIDKVEVTKDYYIIFDNKKPGKILLFNKQGKFVRKISEIPGKKMLDEGFREMWVNQEKKEIITEAFWYQDGAYFVYFDLNGKYLRMEKEPTRGGNDFFYLKGQNFASTQRYFQEGQWKHLKNRDSINYHITLFEDGKMTKQYFPIDTSIIIVGLDDVISSYSGFDVTNNSLLFANTGNYKIYNVNASGIDEVYNILFPLKNSLPADFMINKTYTGKRYQMVNGNPDLIFGLQNIYKINNWLFFSAMHWQGGWDRIMYNLKTATALEMKKVQGDETNGYLPISNLQGIVNVDKENIYTCISSAQMFQAKEEMTKKNPVYGKMLQQYFKTSSRLGNPVLIRLKLKADF